MLQLVNTLWQESEDWAERELNEQIPDSERIAASRNSEAILLRNQRFPDK